ncbi:MAG: hypothetical protein KC561_10825 [Myxococcales bacterium]|nr:hypothetical protein [Myxococcales bacterium]
MRTTLLTVIALLLSACSGTAVYYENIHTAATSAGASVAMIPLAANSRIQLGLRGFIGGSDWNTAFVPLTPQSVISLDPTVIEIIAIDGSRITVQTGRPGSTTLEIRTEDDTLELDVEVAQTAALHLLHNSEMLDLQHHQVRFLEHSQVTVETRRFDARNRPLIGPTLAEDAELQLSGSAHLVDYTDSYVVLMTEEPGEVSLVLGEQSSEWAVAGFSEVADVSLAIHSTYAESGQFPYYPTPVSGGRTDLYLLARIRLGEGFGFATEGAVRAESISPGVCSLREGAWQLVFPGLRSALPDSLGYSARGWGIDTLEPGMCQLQVTVGERVESIEFAVDP